MEKEFNCRVYMDVLVNVAVSVNAENEEKAIDIIKNMADNKLLSRNHILSVGDIKVRTVSKQEKRCFYS
jgi:predicted ATP-grasp superfamily ATP-dependent carboligase